MDVPKLSRILQYRFQNTTSANVAARGIALFGRGLTKEGGYCPFDSDGVAESLEEEANKYDNDSHYLNATEVAKGWVEGVEFGKGGILQRMDVFLTSKE